MAEWPPLLQLFAAFGVGGIFVKLLDLIFLQPQTERREYRNWLREKRFMTYSELIDILTWQGRKGDTTGSTYRKIHGKAIRASILIEDKSILRLITLCILEISSAAELSKDLNDLKMIERYSEVTARVREHGEQINERLKRDLLTPHPTRILIPWIRIKNRLWNTGKRTKRSDRK